MLLLQLCTRMMVSLALLVSSAPAFAQAYPTKSIKIITGTPTGGPGQTSRVLANELAVGLGQPVVVEARPAGIGIGIAGVKSPADGYTIVLNTGATWIAPLLSKEPPYDATRDLAPITLLARGANLLVVYGGLPVKSVKDLIEYARANPGKFNFSTGSNGGSSHLGGELFKSMTGINAVRIQYNDSGREVADMLAGRTHMTFGSGTSMAPLLQTGKVRALAVASAQPSALYPDLPIVASTLPGYVSEQIIGVFAPAGTPAPIIGRLNKEIVAALGKKEIRDTLTAQGLEIVGSTPEVLMAEVKGEISRYGGLIKSLGITTD